MPRGQTVRIVLTSDDVIHAFWVPGLPVQTRRDPGTHHGVRPHADRSTGPTAACAPSSAGSTTPYMVFTVNVVEPDCLRQLGRRAAGRGGGVAVSTTVDRRPPPRRRTARAPPAGRRRGSRPPTTSGSGSCTASRRSRSSSSAGRSPTSSARSSPSRAASSCPPQTYNGLFTIHGTVMIFLFVAPFGSGLGQLPRPACRSARPTWPSRG